MRSCTIISICCFMMIALTAQGQMPVMLDMTKPMRGYALNKHYKEFESIGETLHGSKHGIWKDIHADSVIYVIGEYDNGLPVGKWEINFPDGSPRKVIYYNEQGIPVKWERYHLSQKMAEINSPDGISAYALDIISSYEKMIFEDQLRDFKSHTVRRHYEYAYGGSETTFSYYERITDPYKMLLDMTKVLIRTKLDCEYKLWDVDNHLMKEFTFHDGEEVERISNFYVNGRHKRQYIYENDVLVKEISYNRKGEIKKEKDYTKK